MAQVVEAHLRQLGPRDDPAELGADEVVGGI
jgi:hypothetical protein